MYGSQEKILGQKVNVKFFTVDPYSVGAGVPRTFLELGKIQKNIFLKIKTSTKNLKKMYIKQYIAPASFWFFLNDFKHIHLKLLLLEPIFFFKSWQMSSECRGPDIFGSSPEKASKK